ncbi:MAG: hypothetical protein C0444_00240 [Microbacterium sp.]|nr:hypothetical protein [Microbacterium sp.]
MIGPPSNRAGIIAAAVSLAMMLIGSIAIPQLFPVPEGFDGTEGLDELVAAGFDPRALGFGNALAFLGFVPLLTAAHAFIGQRARPTWPLLTAYLLLLIRPIALVIEASSFPGSALATLGPLAPWALLATTGIAAGFAAAVILPLAQDAASTGRRIAVAAGLGLLVTIALFAFSPFIAPLSALGVGAALLARTGRFDRKNGPAGQH